MSETNPDLIDEADGFAPAGYPDGLKRGVFRENVFVGEEEEESCRLTSAIRELHPTSLQKRLSKPSPAGAIHICPNYDHKWESRKSKSTSAEGAGRLRIWEYLHARCRASRTAADLDGRWYAFDARHNVPRIGRILMASGPRRHGCRAVHHVRRLHHGELHRYYGGDRRIDMGVASIMP